MAKVAETVTLMIKVIGNCAQGEKGMLLQISPIKSNHYVISLSDLFGFDAVWIGLYLYFLYLYLYLYLHVFLQRVDFLKKQQVCCLSSPQLRTITATDYT